LNTYRLQALLSYLLLRSGIAQSRQQLAFLFWPDSSDEQARTNLRTLLHRLRTALPQADKFLTVDQQRVEWQADAPFTLDVADFEAALTEASRAEQDGNQEGERSALERAIRLYKGDLLPDCYDEWVIPEREGLKQLAINALERLMKQLEDNRDYSPAISYGRQLLRLDPLHELAYLSLMRLYAAQGDRPGALRIYHTCSTVLRDELGAAPGPAIVTAYEQLLSSNEALQGPAPAPGTEGTLVGRNPEWARLQAAWQGTVKGRPRMLILSGEAGIGKTRLAEELLLWARRQGALTATAPCYAAEGDLAYAPVVEWLSSEAVRPGLARIDKIWLGEIARLLPELLVQHPDLPQPGPLTATWQRRRLFEALALAFLGIERPILLLIDDLQWCDQDTLEWLHFLLRYKSQARLMVIGTVRVEETQAGNSLTLLLDQLRSSNQLTEIELVALTLAESATLAARLTGRPFPAEALSGLYAETEGNPLFVVEMIRAGFPTGVNLDPGNPFESKPNALPSGMQAVITHQLNQVAPGSREVLRLAAVIGRSFTFRVLERAAEGDQNTLLRGLEDLWQRQIVREQGAESYYFSHDKLRAVAYSELSGVRRRVLHHRVAEALKAEFSGNLDAVSGQIAAHYDQAGQVEDAVEFYRRAANINQRLFANAEAISNLRQALTLLTGPGSGDQPQRQITAAVVYERLGDLLHLTGKYGEARDAYQEALRRVSEGEWLSRTHLHRKIGNTWRDQYRYEEALAACAAAEATLGLNHNSAENDPDLWQAWAHIQMDRMQVHYWLGQTGELLRLGEATWPVVEKWGEPHQLARMYQMQIGTGLRRDRYVPSDDVIQAARSYLRLAEDLQDNTSIPSARFQLGMALLLHNDLDEADQQMRTALTLAEHTGDISLEGRCLTYLTILYRKRGQLEAVQEYAGRSLRLATAGQMPDYIGAACGNLAWLAWRNGNLSEARNLGQQALEAWQKISLAYASQWTALWPLIGVALAENQLSLAAEYARRILDPKQQRLPVILETSLEAAVQAAGLGNFDQVRTELQGIVDLATTLGYL
jgi:DNA-binding SARP family transcriptional activator/predicted ATPase